jgi:hypothetical protein
MATLAGALMAVTDASALVASCPDGSVILAKHWADVRCLGAVEVTPGSTPRLGPARRAGRPDKQAFRRREEAARERDLEHQIHPSWPPPPQVLAAATLPPEPHRNLGLLIALSPTAVSLEGPGLPGRLRLAHSVAFEALLGGALAASGAPPGGPILVFSLTPPADGRGATPPSFAQGGTTFRPAPADPRQLGWITPEAGEAPLAAARLGYVVLPAGFELDRPLAVFWRDEVTAARWRR